ncbi:hypothetical protein [Nocardia salmonicida]|uniref:hypothetical protein n=1 Tax=Nocardia salmonicida TaxID=53431 RepID=UPI00363F3019
MTTTASQPTGTTASLAATITRRLPDTADLTTVASRLADDLLALGDQVPDTDWLILGGSMARGEPSWIRYHHDQRQLISDLDLLYVSSGETPTALVSQLRTTAEKRFPTVDLMTLPLRDYRTITTSLGYDFKNLGVPLTPHGLPEHNPVRLDDRDAYEILLYYIQAYYWHRLNYRWQTGLDSTQFHLLVNRLCMKVLRATAMLERGAYAHHDFARMAPHLAEQMRTELAWRIDPRQPPLDPSRFWVYVHDAFRRFDFAFGGPRPDAVRLSKYATTSSGQIIASHQKRVSELAREVAAAWVSNPRLDRIGTVERATWSRVTGWAGTQQQPGPASYFAKHRREIHDHLLAMKVQVAA